MEVNWNLVVSDTVNQILRIFLPVLVALILRWAMDLYLKIRAEKPVLADALDYAASIAVRAAEQIGGTGEEKKSYAVEAMTQYLAEKGLNINLELISAAIESEVYKMNLWKEFGTGKISEGMNTQGEQEE